MALTAVAPALNPAQQAVLAHLGAAVDERPEFDADLGDRLRERLEEGLAPIVADRDPDDPLVVSKRTLAGVHGCQARWSAESSTRFTWSAPVARGAVAHKAVELSLNLRGEPTPLDLVDTAISRLAEREDGLADWLRTCSDVDRAELRSAANACVAAFVECWPALRPSWVPVAESPARVELCGGRVQLRGKVDLTLGRAIGRRAGKVLVDLKTGSFSPDHLHDLRFYALIETVRIGVPPRRVATYYLEAARMAPEDVTEGRLDAAVARTVAGVAALVGLRSGAEPVRRPGPACSWCPVRTGCQPGEVWMARADDFG
jgi:CRISPR/Cas system-associated exonuclease Cas4 (RecB family)